MEGSSTTDRLESTSVLLIFAFASGAAGLVYQVIWSRLVALIVGSQIEAISVVLVAFFGGLAAGAHVLGRWADHSPSPIRMYGRLEIVAGLGAGASPWLLEALGAVLIGRVPPAVVMVTVGAALFAITFLLGGTIPALVRAAVREPSASARVAGRLVGVNTAGAVTGVGAAVVLIPVIGLTRTSVAAGVIAVLIGLAALAWAKRRDGASAPGSAAPAPSSEREPRPSSGPAGAPIIVLFVAALAGVATLGYEVLAARAAALVLGSSLYAWALVLGLFLVGLAAGNVFAASRAARSTRPHTTLGVIECLAAVCLAIGIAWCVPAFTHGASGLNRVTTIAIAAWALPTTTLMGAAFPWFVRLGVRRAETVGRAFGAVSAANTAGGIAGAMIAPFILLPSLGLAGALLVCATLNGLLGLGLLMWGAPTLAGRIWRPLVAGVAVVAASWMGLSIVRATPPPGVRLVALFHGRQATAAVVRTPGRRDLVVDGDPEASTGGDARTTEELLAILPIITHPDPRAFLEIGLGSGITLGTAAQFPLERIDCVEISQAVIDCAPYFEPDNHAIATRGDERLRLIRGDGRAFLATHAGTYDVIVANTLHPWAVGATGLYSIEYFARIRRGLRPGGIAAQWIPLARLGEEDLGAILRTFYTVFDDGQLWWCAENLLLVGHQGDGAASTISNLRPRVETADAMLERHGIDDLAALERRRLASAAVVMKAIGDGPVLTDDHPRLEAGALRRRRGASTEEEIALVERIAAAYARDSIVAGPLHWWLQSRVRRNEGQDAEADRLESKAIDAGFQLAAEHRAKRTARRALIDLRTGDTRKARAAMRRALEDAPRLAEARYMLAYVAHQRSERREALEEVERLLADHPEHALGWDLLAQLRQRAGDVTGAAEAYDAALAADPFSPEILANAGGHAARHGDLDRARAMLGRLEAIGKGEARELSALRQAIDGLP